MTTTLPEGFRICQVQVAGSGRGDEIFALALLAWEPITARRGLLRRKVQVGMGWVRRETGGWFTPDDQVRRDLTQTAWLLAGSPHP